MESKRFTLDSKDLDFQSSVLKQIPTPVMAVDNNMKVIYLNDSALKMIHMNEEDALGKTCSKLFKSTHCNNGQCCMKKAMEKKETVSSRNEVNFQGKKVPIEYYAVPLIDDSGETIGGLEYILDITERVAHEKRLEEQSHTIREMSTPTIKLWEGVLMLPIVGVVDSMRAQYMMESMLNKIAETYSRVIILDIHGVAAVDTAVANHLIKITKATKLMGCECILSGISPAVAQTIIHLGIDMNTVTTKSTLSDALEEAFRILGIHVEA